MSSTMDPAKLKVVDLRNELATRGLDTKGNKAALVKRLKDALESETDQKLPDSSILETSTEDLDTSQDKDVPVRDASPVKKTEDLSKSPPKPSVDVKPKTDQKTPEKPKAEVKSPDKPSLQSPGKPNIVTKPDIKSPSKAEVKTISPVKAKPTELGLKEAPKVEANGEAQADLGEDAKESGKEGEQTEGDATKMEEDTEQKGEKRKREGDSPQRSQRRRSRSPIKEDEPEINADNVQLNWYDSDLHLQVDKETFLSAKPLTDGAFGYAWAGVRATHGVSLGKVYYEVKITEELKWDDFSKLPDRPRHDRRNYRDRRDRDRRETDRSKDKKPADKEKAEKESKDEGKAEQQENKDEDKTDKEPKSEEKGDAEAVEGEKKEEKMDTSTPSAEAAPMETEEPEKSEKSEKPEKPETSEKPEESAEKEGDEKDKENSADKKEEKPKEEAEPIPTHLFRVGWSQLSNSLQLGEEEFSYGYESSGRFVTNKVFVEYGKKFGVGDVIGAYLDIDEDNVTIQYTHNGELLPEATTVSKSDVPEEDFILFPHVLTRNYAFELNIGNKEEPWFAAPAELEDYVFLSKTDDKVAGPLRPEARADCEVILMCGLPASGKTHWVKEHVGANADKRYTVLGNTTFLEKMTVSGEPIKSKFKGKWSLLIDRIQKCLNRLISIASVRRRNYIIDQTNVFPSAQRRKMRPFEGFKRKAVIIVVGDEEQARRHSLQEAVDGKGVPDSTMLEMKASMNIPEKCDWMEEVVFAELEEAEAKEQVKKYNAAGKEAGYSSEKRFRDRWQNRRNDFRGRNNRNRSYQNQRYDPRGSRWQQPRGHGGPSGGGWNRDRRDNRGPPSRNWRGPQSGSRDNRSQVAQYNRSPRDQGGRWSSGGGGSWSSGGQGGGWNQQTFGGSGSYGNWGSGNWKYNSGGSQGYGGGGGGGYGGGNWNYYGQYAQGQNWGNQKK